MSQEFSSYSEIKEIRPAAGEIFLSNGTNGEPNPVNDGLKILFLLFRHKVFIISSILVATASAVVYSLMLPNWYASTVSVVPPKRAPSALEGALGNLSSALKDIGMTKIGGKSDGYTYMVILNSRRLKDTMISRFNLAKIYDIPDTLHDALRKELSNNLEFSYETDGNYTITAWHTDKNEAARMANTTIQVANNISREIDQQEAVTSRKYLEQRLAQTDAALVAIGDSLKQFTRETYLFSPQDQAKAAATAVAELKAQLMQQEVILSMFKSSYGDEGVNTIRQGELVNDLRGKINSVQTEKGFAGNFALRDASEVGARYIRFYTELETFTKLKALLMPMLEQAKLDERRVATTMYVVDPAVPADKKDRPKRSLIVAGAALAGLIFSVLFIVLRHRYNALKLRYAEAYATLRN